MSYDTGNIFARMLRQQVPCRSVFEDEHVLAFHDIHPKAPVHIVLIPKGAYRDASDFHTHGTPEEVIGLYRACAHVADLMGVSATGYRLISNCGVDAGQEVPHFHIHLLGGEPLKAF